jgi:hypothetical protein
MKLKLEQELKQLELSFKSGKSGLTTNEYSSIYFQLSKKIKSL